MSRLLHRLIALVLAAAVGMAAASIAHAREGGGHGRGGGGGGHGGEGGSHGEHGEGHGGKGEGEGTGSGKAGAAAATANGSVVSMFNLSGLKTGSDAEQARVALSRGEIKPLGTILGAVKTKVDGRVLDVGLDRGWFDGWVYRVTVLGGDGRYSDVRVDARAGTVLDVRKR